MRFDCDNPECFKKLTTPDEHIGTKVRCPACGWKVTVPSAQELGMPERFGEYRTVRLLGEGGTGSVFEVTGNSGERFAIKWLSAKASLNDSYVQRFRREAVAASTLNHPGLVHVHETGEQDGRPFLVMDHVDGETVKEVLKRDGQISPEHALDIASAVARALQYANQKSFIHRDIKPENILLSADGVKLTDLGLAKNIEDDIRVTESGTGVGTPFYMAPEQSIDAAHSDYRADIYSLGITLIHMVTGRLPFEGRNPMEVIRGHVQRPLPTGAELGQPLSEGFEMLLQRMCAKRPDYRFQSYGELLESIARVRTGRLPVATDIRKRNTPTRVRAIVCLLLLFAVLAIAVSRLEGDSLADRLSALRSRVHTLIQTAIGGR